LHLKKTEEPTYFQYKYTFYDQANIFEFQIPTTIITQGNLTSDHEIKQHI